MTTEESATRGTIDAKIAVANLQHVRGCATTGALSPTVP